MCSLVSVLALFIIELYRDVLGKSEDQGLICGPVDLHSRENVADHIDKDLMQVVRVSVRDAILRYVAVWHSLDQVLLPLGPCLLKFIETNRFIVA